MKKSKISIPLMLLGLSLCSCSSDPSFPSLSSASSSLGQDASSEVHSSEEFSSSSGSIASSEEEIELEEVKKSNVYLGTLINPLSLHTYFFSCFQDVPYVEASSFYTSFWNAVYQLDVYEEKDGLLVNSLNGATCKFLPEEDKIFFSDYDLFSSASSLPIPYDVLSVSEDKSAEFDLSSCSYSSGGAFCFDLAPYGAKIIDFEGDILVPFAYLECIAFAPFGNRFAFNGDDYYYVEDSALYSGAQLTPYGRAYHSGSLATNRYRSFDYSEYFYYSFLFEMENFYGKFDSLRIEDLDVRLEEAGLKSELLSENGSVADSAVASAISTLFGDGGHTGFLHRGAGVSYSARIDSELQMEILNSDYRYSQKARRHSELYRKRGGLVPYQCYGGTAVIRFDSFEVSPFSLSPDKETVSSDSSSTFALFYNSFQRIKDNPSVERVVFDVSLNGGGYAVALGQALSFLSEDPIKLRVHNPLTGSDFVEAVRYDNDFDGEYDGDSYQGKYDFYILTSAYSFSCGNAFPCMAQEAGLAKIIGERSGGGDCSVTQGVASDGAHWRMSSNQQLVHADGSSFDSGARVDIALADDYFYDVEKLDAALSNA